MKTDMTRTDAGPTPTQARQLAGELRDEAKADAERLRVAADGMGPLGRMVTQHAAESLSRRAEQMAVKLEHAADKFEREHQEDNATAVRFLDLRAFAEERGEVAR